MVLLFTTFTAINANQSSTLHEHGHCSLVGFDAFFIELLGNTRRAVATFVLIENTLNLSCQPLMT
jgi:hypothetical protein